MASEYESWNIDRTLINKANSNDVSNSRHKETMPTKSLELKVVEESLTDKDKYEDENDTCVTGDTVRIKITDESVDKGVSDSNESAASDSKENVDTESEDEDELGKTRILNLSKKTEAESFKDNDNGRGELEGTRKINIDTGNVVERLKKRVTEGMRESSVTPHYKYVTQDVNRVLVVRGINSALLGKDSNNDVVVPYGNIEIGYAKINRVLHRSEEYIVADLSNYDYDYFKGITVQSFMNILSSLGFSEGYTDSNGGSRRFNIGHRAYSSLWYHLDSGVIVNFQVSSTANCEEILNTVHAYVPGIGALDANGVAKDLGLYAYDKRTCVGQFELNAACNCVDGVLHRLMSISSDRNWNGYQLVVKNPCSEEFRLMSGSNYGLRCTITEEMLSKLRDNVITRFNIGL